MPGLRNTIEGVSELNLRLDEQKIQQALFAFIRSGQDIVLPNISWSYLNSEADLVKITPAGYLYEYEIKISYSDFVNDFRKRKHFWFREKHTQRGKPNYFTPYGNWI